LSQSLVATGAIIMGYTVAAVFFVKFWRRTRDFLFLAFAAAFLLMATTPLLTTWLEVPREEQSPFYLLRLLAFLIIIVAIVWKSRRR
jgi:zinc transporter ZupT